MNRTRNAQSTVARLFRQLKGQRARLAVVAVSIVVYVGLSIYTPMFSAVVIDHLWQSIQAAWNDGTPFAITWTNMGQELTQLTVQYFFTWIFYYLQSYLMVNVAESLNLELRNQIARKLNRLSLRFFDQNKAGEILSRVTSDLDKIAEVLQTGLLKLVVAIGTIVGSLLVMFYYSWQLTCIFLVFMAISMVITQLVAKKNLRCAAQRQETIGELTGIVEEYYNGRDVIKAYNHEEESLAQVAASAERNRAANQKAANLSAGQRQLLTIARVFLRDPPIIILDEATSSVDTRTEVEIGKAMKQLMCGRTSFVIAHRLSTIRDADIILFMEHGNIIEQGSHTELLKKKGAYAALYYSQFE